MNEIPDDIRNAAWVAFAERDIPRGIMKAILAERQRNQWHDMSTAPMDGTKIDVYFAKRGRETDVYYQKTGVMGWAKKEGYPAVTRIIFDIATHWMPIPSEPFSTAVLPSSEEVEAEEARRFEQHEKENGL